MAAKAVQASTASTLTEESTEESVDGVLGGDGLVQKTSGTFHLLGAQPRELVGDKLLLSC